MILENDFIRVAFDGNRLTELVNRKTGRSIVRPREFLRLVLGTPDYLEFTVTPLPPAVRGNNLFFPGFVDDAGRVWEIEAEIGVELDGHRSRMSLSGDRDPGSCSADGGGHLRGRQHSHCRSAARDAGGFHQIHGSRP